VSDRRKEETKLQKAIVDALKLQGIYVLRTNSGKVPAKRGWVHLQPKGTPDLHGAIPVSGRMFAVEVKVPGEKPDAAQLAKGAELVAKGILHGFVWSVDDAVNLVTAWALAERENDTDG
jgi:hypothetical protein